MFLFVAWRVLPLPNEELLFDLLAQVDELNVQVHDDLIELEYRGKSVQILRQECTSNYNSEEVEVIEEKLAILGLLIELRSGSWESLSSEVLSIEREFHSYDSEFRAEPRDDWSADNDNWWPGETRWENIL